MFGLDLISILAAAVGGGIGAAIAGLLAQRFVPQPYRVAVIAGLVVAGAALSSLAIRPLLDTSIGTTVRSNQFDATYESEVLPEIKKIPALERIFRERPDVEARFRAKAREVFQSGGANALVEQSAAIGAVVLGDAFASYMPRARKEDLVLFAATMADVLKAFYDKDPEGCIFYQFGANYGKPLTPQRMLAAIGEERQKKQIDVMNAVVMNAGDQPIPFDDAKAAQAVAAMGARHTALLTPQSAEVAQGRRPPNDEAEAKVACSFAVALFTDLATMNGDTTELILRKMFSGQR